MDNKDYITVGEITKQAGITRQGVYYYEDKGLIKPVMLAGRLRLYSRDTITLIKKIQELKETYKLEAIKKMIEEGKI